MKKLLLFMLIAFCAASLSASGKSGAAQVDREVFKVKTFGWNNTDYSLFPEAFAFVKEKFGLEIEVETLGSANFQSPSGLEKPQLIWSSGDYPHFNDLYFSRFEQFNWPGIYDRLLDLKPHFDKVPNIRAWFTDAEWEAGVKRYTLPDGKMPFLFGYSYRIANHAWSYEKSTFDNLGIDEPKTLDDLYKALKILRAEFPDPQHYLITSRQSFASIPLGIGFAYRIDTGMGVEGKGINIERVYNVDPDTGELTFFATSDKYLDTLRYCKRLMDEGLSGDMTTVRDEGIFWNEDATSNRFFIMHSYPRDARGGLQERAAEKNPDVNWQMMRRPISATADRVAVIRYTPADHTNGTFLTDKCTDEVRDRILEMLDWFATRDEHGIPLTWTALDEYAGKPTMLFNWDSNKLDGYTGAYYPKEWALGEATPDFRAERSPWYGEHGDSPVQAEWTGGGSTPWWVPAPWPYRYPGNRTIYRDSDAMEEMAIAVRGGSAEFLEKVTWGYTADELAKRKNLEGAIVELQQYFTDAFLKGEVAEAAWDDYKRDLQRAGLDELTNLMTTVYKRSN